MTDWCLIAAWGGLLFAAACLVEGGIPDAPSDPQQLYTAVDAWLSTAMVPADPVMEAGEEPFDLVFLDADKENYPHYLEGVLALSRPGTLLVADNVVRGGRILDEATEDPSVQGSRRFNRMLGEEPRLLATALQVVGAKGHDGLALALVRD